MYQRHLILRVLGMTYLTIALAWYKFVAFAAQPIEMTRNTAVIVVQLLIRLMGLLLAKSIACYVHRSGVLRHVRILL